VRPAVRYARNGDVSIAYQVIGDGPVDLVFQPGFVSHLDLAWEEPFLARFLESLAAVSRLIWFDKRGTGLSDPIEVDVPVEHRIDDVRAVMDAAGSDRAALFGVSEGAALSVLYALAHPERVTSLVLWAGFPRFVVDDDDEGPGWLREFFEAFLDGLDQVREDGTGIGLPNPSVEGDERYRDWFVRYVRAAAAPGLLRRVMAANATLDLRPVLGDVDKPTLVLHRVDEAWVAIDHSRYLAAHIPGATLVELPGVDHWPWLGDADGALNEIEAFLTGVRRARRPRPLWGVGSLTRREHEAARLAATGLPAADIAARLGIGERTVETHLANAYLKLGVSSKVELAREAARLGL
jgi:pimeloyl-ACP methyl ester carboxylesterase/DNA-binding CsgD family transcriptional regulator